MSARPSRAWFGNALVLLLLALVGWALLRLHLGEAWWQGAPPIRQSQIALIATALYALACTALWWRGRPRDDAPSGDTAPILLVWASQTGFARELADRSAEALRGAGVPVRVRGLHEVDAALLTASQRALFIASTTGEGDPPDHALPFLRGVMTTPPPMQHLHYGVLALGDRSYGHFCGFGHQLDQWLRQHGAHPLFDAIEVDNADPAALRHWQQLLGQLGGGANELPDWSPAEYQPWTLLQREHLKPGSPGGPVYWLRLQPPAGAAVQWQAGDIAEIGPQHARHSARAWLAAPGFAADRRCWPASSARTCPHWSLPGICLRCWQPCSRCRIASTRLPRSWPMARWNYCCVASCAPMAHPASAAAGCAITRPSANPCSCVCAATTISMASPPMCRCC